MAKIAKVANPSLLIVNGSKAMTRTVKKGNTTKRNTTKRPGRAATNKAKNSTNVRRRRRSTNPSIKVMITGAVCAAAGAMAHGAIASIIPVKASGPLGLLISGFTAWLTWYGGERILSGTNALAFGLGAAGGFGAQVIQYVMGLASQITGQLAPASAPEIGGGNKEQKQLPAPPEGAMQDIAMYGRSGQGLSDIAMYTRRAGR